MEQIQLDEAIEILRKFLQLTIKDYIQPAIRFSRLSSEQENYETAREFILGEIAVPWGDLILTFSDLCEILGLDPLYWQTKIEYDRIARTDKFLRKGRKKKKDLMSIVCFTHCCSAQLTGKIRLRLKQIGISPVISPVGPVEFYNDFSAKELEELTEKQKEDLLDQRTIIRRQVDRHTLLLSRADVMLVVWTAGVNEFQVLMDIVTAYRNYIPVFIIMTDDGPNIDSETLACARTVTVGSEAIDKMFDILKEFIGTGQAQIARSIRPKLADILQDKS